MTPTRSAVFLQVRNLEHAISAAHLKPLRCSAYPRSELGRQSLALRHGLRRREHSHAPFDVLSFVDASTGPWASTHTVFTDCGLLRLLTVFPGVPGELRWSVDVGDEQLRRSDSTAFWTW